MAIRKGWDNLSAPYKARLTRHGISKRIYESGSTLKKARGHGPSTKSERRKQDERNIKAGLSPALSKLVNEGLSIGVSEDDTRIVAKYSSIKFVHIIFQFKIARNKYWIDHGSPNSDERKEMRAKGKYNPPDVRDLENWARRRGFKWSEDYVEYEAALNYDSPYIYYH